MPGHFTGRVVTAVFLLQIDAWHIQRHDLLRAVRCDVAAQVDKLAILPLTQQALQLVRTQAQQARHARTVSRRRHQLLRIHPYRLYRRTDSQRLSVAIDNHATVRGHLDNAQVTHVALPL